MKNIDMTSNIAWTILFGDSIDDIPDPNKPENIPHIKALKRQKIDSIKNFVEGPGKPLFDELQREIRVNIFSLFDDKIECNCSICMKIIKIKYVLQLIVNIQRIIKEA